MSARIPRKTLVAPPTSARDSAEASLFGAPLAAFTRTRNDLATKLRKRGSTAEATKIAAYKRPTRTAWALNQVARRDPDQVRALLDAIATLRSAQANTAKTHVPDVLRDSSRGLNVRVATILAIAKQVAIEDGTHLTATQERTITRTLRALPFAPRADVERFAKGTLVADLEADSDAPWFASRAPAKGESTLISTRTTASPRPPKKVADAAATRAAARAERALMAREQARAKLEEREARRIETRVAKADRDALAYERQATALEKRAAALRQRASDTRRDARAGPAR